MEKIRTFTCIEITDIKIINKIKTIQQEFKNLRGKIKSIEGENIHVTLKFLGSIPLSLSEQITEVLDEIKFKPFDLNLYNVGCFPNVKRPRIVWVGTRTGTENVIDIYNQIENKLSMFDFKKEKKFTSHITISRIKFLERPEISKFGELINSFKDKNFGTIKVSSFQFKKSTLTPKGAIYKNIRNFEM